MNQQSTYHLSVEQVDSDTRLDKYLSSTIPELSRSRLQTLIEKGLVTINDSITKDCSYKIKYHQHIIVTVPPLEEAIPTPQEIALNILFEDDDLIVINKPAGMVVHPAPGNAEGTLVNALLSHCGDSLSGIGGVKRPGIVHRLDKETSGLLVAAKNDKAHHHLAHQLSIREMERQYVAITWGMLSPNEGTLEGPIARDPRHRQRMTIRSDGKPARTHYKVTQYFGTFASQVECKLDTGRTHQIRVHLSKNGHPLIGDPLYGKFPKGVSERLREYLKNDWPSQRQALHAQSLSFIHPTTHKKHKFTVDLPKDMINLISMLESLQNKQ